MTKIKTIAAAVAVAVLLVGSNVEAAPVSYTGQTYTENFDWLPWAIPETTWWQWVNDSTVPGWHASGVSWLRSGRGGMSGEQNGKAIFSFGTNDYDNSLGSQFADGRIAWQEPVRFGVEIVNDTGLLLTEFTLSYFGELWGGAYRPRIEQLTFDYAVNALSITGDNYVAAPELNFVSPHMNANDKLDGNLPQNRTFISSTVRDLNWRPGESLWLRWSDVDDPGLHWDVAMAIDDLEFSAGGMLPPQQIAVETAVTQALTVAEPDTAALAALSMLTLGFLLRKAAVRNS